jgi:hypothetical protein
MNWLVLWFALTVGYSPDSMMLLYTAQQQMFFPDAAYVELNMELRAFNDHFFIGGDVRTEIQKFIDGTPTFVPEMASYGFHTGIRDGGMEIGVLYVCQHPVVPYYSEYHPFIVWEGWYAEGYIRFSGQAKLF